MTSLGSLMTRIMAFRVYHKIGAETPLEADRRLAKRFMTDYRKNRELRLNEWLRAEFGIKPE